MISGPSLKSVPVWEKDKRLSYPFRTPQDAKQNIFFETKYLNKIFGVSHGDLIQSPHGEFCIVIGEYEGFLWVEKENEFGASYWDEIRSAHDLFSFGFHKVGLEKYFSTKNMTHLADYTSSNEKRKETSDLKIQVGSKTFFVHRVFFRSCSKYFEILTSSVWTDPSKDTVHCSCIGDGAAVLTSVESIIQWVYTGRLSLKDTKDFLYVLILADFWMIESLEEQCWKLFFDLPLEHQTIAANAVLEFIKVNQAVIPEKIDSVLYQRFSNLQTLHSVGTPAEKQNK